MIRLFISIPTPTSVLPRLAEARDILRESLADVKWEPTEKLHCTIKFLGDTPEELVRRVADALHEIGSATQPLSVAYEGIGCFPDRGDPRILWAGMKDPEDGIKWLFKAVEENVSRFGFERERRALHPHVTLGRVKSTRRLAVLLGMMETVTLKSPLVMIQEIDLVKSTLGAGGSVYSLVARAQLAGRQAGSGV